MLYLLHWTDIFQDFSEQLEEVPVLSHTQLDSSIAASKIPVWLAGYWAAPLEQLEVMGLLLSFSGGDEAGGVYFPHPDSADQSRVL